MSSSGATQMPPHGARAFGFDWESDVPLAAFPPGSCDGAAAPIGVRLMSGSCPERGELRPHGNVRFAYDGFRYLAGDEGVIDVHADARLIRMYPGPAWTGAPPAALYSTVAGLLCASLDCLPLHGSAVARDGEATLICGPAGAGKSTTAARLLAEGALLVSDDLSVLHPDAAGGVPRLFAGRRFVRLYPQAAQVLTEAVGLQAPTVLADGKLAVFPRQVSPFEVIPLRRVILLGQPAQIVPPRAKASLLAEHFFRPRCLRSMPGFELRLAMLAVAARSLEVIGAPAL